MMYYLEQKLRQEKKLRNHFQLLRFSEGESMFDRQPSSVDEPARSSMCTCSQHTSIITQDTGMVL